MSKKACLIYIQATEPFVEDTTALLEAAGFEVCVEIADAEVAQQAKEGKAGLPENIEKCIKDADECVILYPGDDASDVSLGGVGGACSDSGARVVGVCCGTREQSPADVDDFADSYVHSDSPKLSDAINGESCWENSDRTPAPPRKIDRVKCQ